MQSLAYQAPAWQALAPGFPAPGGSQPAMRQVPNVVMLGSDGPYYVSPAGTTVSSFGDRWGGGTSGANPVFATGILRLDADLLAAAKTTLAYPNPTLYALADESCATAFNDITTGMNDLFGVACCGAGVGYDMATGLGAPRFSSSAWASLP